MLTQQLESSLLGDLRADVGHEDHLERPQCSWYMLGPHALEYVPRQDVPCAPIICIHYQFSWLKLLAWDLDL